MTIHILIVNQHGENRGDEAAMRAMLSTFQEEVGDVEFTLLYQFRDRSLRLTFEQDVEDLPIILPVLDYFRLLIFTTLKLLRTDCPSLLSPTLKKIIQAYRRTSLVVSAPGGPYFGDLYANHELLHWWFILLAHLYKKPIYLYATSAGPFKIKSMNLIRRWLYPKFAKLVTREEISAEYIKTLLGKDTKVTVTADSAIQQSFTPFPRELYFDTREHVIENKLLVAVVLNDYKYPKSDDPSTLKSQYNKEITAVLEYLIEKQAAYLLFFPQLYGGIHCDTPYLLNIAKSLPKNSWEIVDPDANSDTQRQLFAMCDIHFASRYHPAIFGNTAMVPGICIYYEHKALGFMRQLNLEKYAFDIRTINSRIICSALDELILDRQHIVDHLTKIVPELRKRAKLTTTIAVELISNKS